MKFRLNLRIKPIFAKTACLVVFLRHKHIFNGEEINMIYSFMICLDLILQTWREFHHTDFVVRTS